MCGLSTGLSSGQRCGMEHIVIPHRCGIGSLVPRLCLVAGQASGSHYLPITCQTVARQSHMHDPGQPLGLSDWPLGRPSLHMASAKVVVVII